MLKDILGRGKCLLGIHAGGWHYQADRACRQVWKCERCGNEDHRVEHEWGEWELAAPEQCDRVRSCRRCGEKSHEVVHDWGEPEYLTRECEQTRQCARCGEEQPAGTAHQWGEWVFLSAADCNQVQVCARCGELGEKPRLAHRWGPWRYSEEDHDAVHECRVCSARGVRAGFKPLEDAAYDSRVWAAGGRAVTPVAAPEHTATADDVEKELLAAKSDEEMWSIGVDKLRRMVAQDQAAGKVNPLRSQTLFKTLEDLKGAIESNPVDLAGRIAHGAVLDRLLEGMADIVTRNEGGGADESSRAGTLVRLLNKLNGYVVQSFILTHGKSQEKDEAIKLTRRIATARNALNQAADEAGAYAYERENVRRVALDVRAFAQRHHLTVARPIWGHVAANARPDAVCFSGGDDIRALLAKACDRSRLELLPAEGHGEPSRFGFEQLRECHVAVFDLSRFDRERELDGAADLAPTAYAMGIAVALGKPIVAVGLLGGEVPFDLDIEPVFLGQDGDPTAVLARALDHAVYGIQRGGSGDSVADTVAHVRQLPEARADSKVRVILKTLSAEGPFDALEARGVLANALAHASMTNYALFHSSWPGTYPEADSPRCFHITGFRPWTEPASAEIREACGRSGVAYQRGDEAPSPNIIRAIWEEIGRATHVVVDLSGLNINAVMELGMVHTLGRNVLLVGQEIGGVRPSFRAIAKQRLTQYRGDDFKSLRQALDTFLSRRPAASESQRRSAGVTEAYGSL
jgi:hypothetical protein